MTCLSRLLVAVTLLFVLGSAPAMAQPAPKLVVETTKGTFVITMKPDLAPAHVERVVTLAGEGFYNNVPFHRVIPGFMAQTGDPTGTGTGGSKLADLKAEFTSTPFVRGTVGMARTSNPDSANSQFFIMFGRAEWLDGQYTVFGEVTEGMDIVDRIKKGDGNSGMVDNPDRIIQIRVE